MIWYLIACTYLGGYTSGTVCTTSQVASEDVCHALIAAQDRLLRDRMQWEDDRPFYRCVSVRAK